MATSPVPEKSFIAALHRCLPKVLPEFLRNRRWFGGKARAILAIDISDVVPLYQESSSSYLILAKVNYASGPAETYDIPLIRLPDGAQKRSGEGAPFLSFRPENVAEDIVLTDALADERFLGRLLNSVANDHSFLGAKGAVRTVSTDALRPLWQPSQGLLTPSLMNAEQSNSSIVYDQRLVLKLFRRVEEGLNPDLEIGSFLTERSSFRNVPSVAGYLEYLSHEGTRMSLGVLQGYVANQGDAWQFTLRALAEYYRKALQVGSLGASEIPQAPVLALCDETFPDEARQRIGDYLDWATLLGRRTAELHMALASEQKDVDFIPEPFSEGKRQALVKSALELLHSNFDLLRRRKDNMPDHVRPEAEKVLNMEDKAWQRFQLLERLKNSVMLTRIHGDYHLGQVLFTGSDFVIIDFEGEPARSLDERRKKRSPLQDVAGMLRSFHYAAYAPILQQANAPAGPGNKLQVLGNWAHYWQMWISAAFLKTYLAVCAKSPCIPGSKAELALLLDLHLLEKAVYELGYELNNRPSWVRIPLDGISQLLQVPASS